MKCKECGGAMVDTGDVLTSNPVQYRYKCADCGKFENMREVAHIEPSYKDVRQNGDTTEIITSAENLTRPTQNMLTPEDVEKATTFMEPTPTKLTPEELSKAVDKLFKESGYQQTLLFFTLSGIQVPPSDAMREGFRVELVLTEAKPK